MIPASYLYKDIYRQTWLDPELESAKARHDTSPRDGHSDNSLAAFLARVTSLLHHRQPAPLASDPY